MAILGVIGLPILFQTSMPAGCAGFLLLLAWPGGTGVFDQIAGVAQAPFALMKQLCRRKPQS